MKAWRLIGALALILLIGGVSSLAAIGSIGGSDSCGGCDTTPIWASIGMTASLILLGVWLVYVLALICDVSPVVPQDPPRCSFRISSRRREVAPRIAGLLVVDKPGGEREQPQRDARADPGEHAPTEGLERER